MKRYFLLLWCIVKSFYLHFSQSLVWLMSSHGLKYPRHEKIHRQRYVPVRIHSLFALFSYPLLVKNIDQFLCILPQFKKCKQIHCQIKKKKVEIQAYKVIDSKCQIIPWKEQSQSIVILGNHSVVCITRSPVIAGWCMCLLHLQNRKFLVKIYPIWNCFCWTHPMQTYSVMQTLSALYKYYHLYFLFVFLKGVFGKICIVIQLIQFCILLGVQMLWI